jgi:hypothetical protein
MELFLLVIGALGFFGLLLMIRGNQDDINRLKRKVTQLEFQLSSLDIKLSNDSIKNNIRAIDYKLKKNDEIILKVIHKINDLK